MGKPMRSFLFTAILELFASVFRRRPTPTATLCDQITQSSTSPPPPSPRSTVQHSISQRFASVPAAQVSNPSATVVPTSGHNQHDSDRSSQRQSHNTPVNSAAQINAFLKPASVGSSPEDSRNSRRVNQSESSRYRRQRRDENEQRIEGMVTALLRGFCFRQAVVIGRLPSPLPRGKVFVISPRVDVPPRCLHVCCEPLPEEWPVALALTGFDWRETTVWLLRMQHASDSVVLQQLKAVEMMSAPCSVVVLLSSLPNVAEVVDGAGFAVDIAQNERPLFLLRKKQRHGRCMETHTPNMTPPCSPPPKPESERHLIRFELHINSLPERVRHGLARGCTKVVGNRHELGAWNVDHGVRLVRAEDILLGEVFVGKGETEYKYIYVDGEGSVLWEVGENRRLTYSDHALLRLEEHWRHY